MAREKRHDGQRMAAQNIAIVVGLMWIALLVLTGRYFYIQIIKGAEFANLVDQTAGSEWIRQTPRAAIVDRNGRELAVTLIMKSLFIDPNNVKDSRDVAKKLAPLIGFKEEKILECIDEGGGFVWVKHFLTDTEYRAVQNLINEENYNCLGFNDEPKRFYPNDVLAAHILGFVGTDDKGLYGIESAFDNELKGDKREIFIKTDKATGNPILDSIHDTPHYDGSQGKKVVLTIDSTIQFIVEQALDEVMADVKPLATTAIVMSPKTGEILAMANRPAFNPNRFEDSTADRWRNRAVSYLYEPGSTFKAVVSAAALEERIVTPNRVFEDPGVVKVSDRTIMNWNGESFGTVTFTDVVRKSINTCFALVGLEMGADNLLKYAYRFGFGEHTGIELAGDEEGLLYDKKDMHDPEIATMAIGHSVTVTPLQLINAISAIANDGRLMRPYIVKRIEKNDGTIVMETEPKERRRAITSVTDKALTDMLEQVVATGGGHKAYVEGYRIAGKTGTAEKVQEYGKGYMDGHYIASFCGFAPVENPELVVYVMIDDPSGIYYGGQIAAPVAGQIFTQLFRYLHIEPSSNPLDMVSGVAGGIPAAPKVRQESRVPDVSGMDAAEAQLTVEAAGFVLAPRGRGVAVSQKPVPGTIQTKGLTVEVIFEPEQPSLPKPGEGPYEQQD